MKTCKTLAALALLGGLFPSSMVYADSDTVLGVRAQSKQVEFSLPGRAYDSESNSYNFSVTHSLGGGLGGRLGGRLRVGAFVGYSETAVDFDGSTAETDSENLSYGANASYRFGRASYVAIGYSSGDGSTDVETVPGVAAFDFDTGYDAYSVSLSQAVPINARLLIYMSIAYSHLESQRDRFNSGTGASVPRSDSNVYAWTLSPTLMYRAGDFTHYYRLSRTRLNVDASGAEDPKSINSTLGTRYRWDPNHTVDVSISKVTGKAETKDTSVALAVQKKL